MPPRTKKAEPVATATTVQPSRKRAASATSTVPPLKRVTRNGTKATEAPVPAVKPKRRSHAQVLADAAQKQADLEALLEEMKENRRKLAEIEIDEEEMQEMEDDARIESLRDLEDPSDEDEPFFPVNDDIELDDADLDGVDESVKTKNLKRQDLKPGRGETTAAVAEIRDKIRTQRTQRNVGRGGSVKGKAKNKKTQNPGNPKSAGGLHTDWKNRSDKVIDSLTVDDHSDDTGLGGLDDEDVIAEMPPITVKPKVQSNEFVKVTAPKTRKAIVTPVKSSSKKATRTILATKLHPSIKKELSSESVIELSDSGTPSPKTKTLPEFMVAAWNTRGTDTAYGLLFTDAQPFIRYAKGSQLLEVVKVAAEGLWPKSDYVVKKGDALYEKFYDRCTEARSKIGARAQAVVEAFFAQDIYAQNVTERQGYALYALQKDGPLLYQNPSPRNIKPNAPGYLAPTGSFLSDHIVQVIKVFLPHYAQSALEHGIPIGLLGMAAAGLERAFRMYTSTGEKSSRTTGFTLVNVNNAVEAYAQSAAKISESRWKKLQDLCGVLVADAATLSMEDSEVFEISASRHLMYDASSPPPESK
ncbi:hypothetical protein F5879DRAFT_1002819 [Lentinula edodes]|nr:hypothetical protein F5879DRAFT_1002819 [Lentinula edodes]